MTSAPRAINKRFGISDENFPNSFWPVTSWAVGAALTPMVILPVLEDYGMRVGYLVMDNPTQPPKSTRIGNADSKERRQRMPCSSFLSSRKLLHETSAH